MAGGGCGCGEGAREGVSSGVGRTVAVAGVFGAGVFHAVVAGVFCGVPLPRRGRIGSGGGGARRLVGRSGRWTRYIKPRNRSSYIIRRKAMNVVPRNVTATFSVPA